jgi:hypothetical protein
MKPQIVNIENCLQALGDFNVDAHVEDEYSRVNEIRLTLSLAASQTWQDAVWMDQPNTSLGQSYSVAVPE